MIFSIIICTYNRDEILKESINEIRSLDFDFKLFEVIIIDNYGKSNTKDIVSSFLIHENFNINYHFEQTPGLSYARNKGYDVANGEWIFYLDDDALIDSNYLKLAVKYLSDANKFCLGGVYNPWYKFKKPKWYRDEWATSMNKPNVFSVLNNDQFLDGNNFMVNKKVLVDLGGFRTDLGMKEMSIGYGEETELQIRLRQSGKDIYYSPELVVSHLVPLYKMRVIWILRSWYNHGKYYWTTYNVQPSGYRFGIKTIISIIILIVRKFISNTPNFLEKDYFIQNLLIDTFKMPIWEFGRLIGSKSNNVRN
jgi:glucosyl-dolichyl phosphate glucuronosyltransferase